MALPLRLVALALAGPVVLGGCYSLTEPSFRPGASRDLFGSISRRVTATAPLPGESACADPELIDNAMRLTAATESDPEPREVFIYTFRTRGWDESETLVDACAAEYAAANPEAIVRRVDVPVWRAFGADWSDELERELRAAFEEAQDAG